MLTTVFTSSFRLVSRMATFYRVETDPDYKIHTSYYRDFFLLRTRVLVNGRNTEIRSIEGGKYVVWFPDPSCMGGAREGRKGLVNNSTPTWIHGCIPAVSVDEGKHECQVGVSRE